ncbi:50S ribosomal subunit protein L18 [Candidatus Kuenenia stuttgartiensis]|jgi:large subunit ribosomal protein L18|uniref:Large ribosomal subunit protein uL18 n=1 Tax=Kuenenia stuttgartiensis TaxID=174633 RepID=Q1Q160_KUEST|nr:50S ribosomal protein L18 [Candidatus Kuenenia stuttgartiensis]MBE7547838.1 50S ribosomal protein L18 [Planctomycetia bacterium]MCF6152381.1 50S ribosomal protein L18 [Candidatus Kuenenia stuttgartiensis]QII10767.1 50S ribosomal subunit protein L18 [Candidatus Kuenenia stuttgartiensis]TVM01631.1 MAG: 50S ribosomal protein L18 [Candidatus Kuenenia stuttgartiensis]CAJ73734.1 strongly similar to 50S ribosomal protein L18 [Candidatus Kuenenia stuttgartiensis]
MDPIKEKRRKRAGRHKRIRKKVIGSCERPRLSVYRSLKNIYCQIIDDNEGKTLVAISTLTPDVRASIVYGGNIKAAEIVGEKLAERAIKKGITKVVFDKGGYAYHGRVKALAESARKNSLNF